MCKHELLKNGIQDNALDILNKGEGNVVRQAPLRICDRCVVISFTKLFPIGNLLKFTSWPPRLLLYKLLLLTTWGVFFINILANLC
mmetsp:Transcript_46905/g.106377  ORF Transcript_46905/g.106377 Transcript_46905/m.106377 type:complete len:86 (-) Transcript_46905:91-348(-)